MFETHISVFIKAVLFVWVQGIFILFLCWCLHNFMEALMWNKHTLACKNISEVTGVAQGFVAKGTE